jgi:hypothetical protein
MKVIYRIFFIFILFLSFVYSSSMDVNLYKSYINSQIDMREITKTFKKKHLHPLKKRVIPKYATAWPKKVKVLKPDPVLGDKDVWEHWIYNEEFAKRFEGFDVEKADGELKKSPIKAIYISIFKQNLWQKLDQEYPEQYVISLNIYFDNKINLISSKGMMLSRERYSRNFPYGISFEKLKFKNKNNKKLFAYTLKKPPIFFPFPLDGRYKVNLGWLFYPNIFNDISLVTFKENALFNGVVVPLQKEKGSLWISLKGENPFYDKRDKRNRGLANFPEKIYSKFKKDQNSIETGYVKFPKSFYEILLPKAVLIKNLNSCINLKYSHDTYKYKERFSEKAKKFGDREREVLKECENTKQTGEIFSPYSLLYDGIKQSFKSPIF